MGAQVAFDYKTWILRFPEFDDLDAKLAQLYFNEAAMFCANDGSGRIEDPNAQAIILNLLTAHIAKMNAPAGGDDECGPSQAVGRVNTGTEGTVTAGLEYDMPPGTPQWYAQTKYGAAAWQVMAAAGLHSAIYIPGHPRVFWP